MLSLSSRLRCHLCHAKYPNVDILECFDLHFGKSALDLDLFNYVAGVSSLEEIEGLSQ